jgi:hypothetical protein
MIMLWIHSYGGGSSYATDRISAQWKVVVVLVNHLAEAKRKEHRRPAGAGWAVGRAAAAVAGVKRVEWRLECGEEVFKIDR